MTASVAGDAISELCLKRAGMLNLHVYDTARNTVHEALHPYMDINDNEWVVVENWPGTDGFLARLYLPKSVADGADPSTACPPVLCFRGSDSDPEDFAEMAAGMRLEFNFFYDLWNGGVTVERIEDLVVDESVSHDAAGLAGKSMAELDTLAAARGMKKEWLFNGVQGEHVVQIGGWRLTRADLTLRWTASSALYYGENGDWAVNFSQGLGNVPPQYSRAIELGKQAADFAVGNGNRLIITGHSLGGGLASAASVAARIHKPDLLIKSVTYNAAGLSNETAIQAGGTRATAGEIPVRALHVKDEILNSMQSRSRLVPFLADLLQWGGQEMPLAVTNPTPAVGRSPGPMSISGKEYAPLYAALPMLFHIANRNPQSAADLGIGPQTPEISRIVSIANNANDVNTFVRNLIDHVMASLSAGGTLGYWEAGRAATSFGNLPEGLKDAVTDAVMSNTTPSQIDALNLELGDSDFHNDILEPYINNLIEEAVVLARIMLASGEYHTFPPCAFTFCMSDNRGR